MRILTLLAENQSILRVTDANVLQLSFKCHFYEQDFLHFYWSLERMVFFYFKSEERTYHTKKTKEQLINVGMKKEK